MDEVGLLFSIGGELVSAQVACLLLWGKALFTKPRHSGRVLCMMRELFFFPAVKTPASLFSPGPVDVELLLFKVELSLAKY